MKRPLLIANGRNVWVCISRHVFTCLQGCADICILKDAAMPLFVYTHPHWLFLTNADPTEQQGPFLLKCGNGSEY